MFNSMIIKDVQVGFFDEYQNYNIFALGMDYRLSVYPELNIAIGPYCEIFLNSLKIPILIGIFYTVKLDYGGYILFKLKFNKIKILFGLNYNNGISYTCFISSYINNAFLNINLGSDIRGSIQSKDKNRLSSLNYLFHNLDNNLQNKNEDKKMFKPLLTFEKENDLSSSLFGQFQQDNKDRDNISEILQDQERVDPVVSQSEILPAIYEDQGSVVNSAIQNRSVQVSPILVSYQGQGNVVRTAIQNRSVQVSPLPATYQDQDNVRSVQNQTGILPVVPQNEVFPVIYQGQGNVVNPVPHRVVHQGGALPVVPQRVMPQGGILPVVSQRRTISENETLPVAPQRVMSQGETLPLAPQRVVPQIVMPQSGILPVVSQRRTIPESETLPLAPQIVGTQGETLPVVAPQIVGTQGGTLPVVPQRVMPQVETLPVVPQIVGTQCGTLPVVPQIVGTQGGTLPVAPQIVMPQSGILPVVSQRRTIPESETLPLAPQIVGTQGETLPVVVPQIVGAQVGTLPVAPQRVMPQGGTLPVVPQSEAFTVTYQGQGNVVSPVPQRVVPQGETLPVVPQRVMPQVETLPVVPQIVGTQGGTLPVAPQRVMPQGETLPVAPQRVVHQGETLPGIYQDQYNIVIENYDLGEIESTPLSREISGNLPPNNNQVQGDIIQSFVSRDDGAQPEVLVDRSVDEEVFDERNHNNQTQTNLAQLDLEEDDDTQSEILVDRSVEAEGGPFGQRLIRVTRGISTENNNNSRQIGNRSKQNGSQNRPLFMVIDTKSESVFNQRCNNSYFLDSTLNSNGLSEFKIEGIKEIFKNPKDSSTSNYMIGTDTNNFLDNRNSHIKNQNKLSKDREEDLEKSFITVSTDLELDETTIKIKRIVKNIMNKKTIKKRIMHYPIIIRSRNTNYMSPTLSSQLKSKNKMKYIKKEKNKHISPKKLRKTRPKPNYMSPTISSNNKKVKKRKLI